MSDKTLRKFRLAMAAILADKNLRYFIFAVIYEICRVGECVLPNNAEVYKVTGKQEVGMRLLNLLRAVDCEKAFEAEKEYIKANQKCIKGLSEDEADGKE